MPLINQIQPAAPVQRVSLTQRALSRAYRPPAQTAADAKETKKNPVSVRITQISERNFNRALVRRQGNKTNARLAFASSRTQTPFQNPVSVPGLNKISQNFQANIIIQKEDTTPTVFNRKTPLQIKRENLTYSAGLNRAGLQTLKNIQIGTKEKKNSRLSIMSRQRTISYFQTSNVLNNNPRSTAGFASGIRLDLFA